MKLSKIEKITNRTLVIKEGNYEWVDPKIEVKFELPSVHLLQELSEKVFNKLGESDTNSHLVYLSLPILTDIEVDKDMDYFNKAIEKENYAAIMIFKGVLEQIKGIFEHCFQITYTKVVDERFKEQLKEKLSEILPEKKADSVPTDKNVEEAK